MLVGVWMFVVYNHYLLTVINLYLVINIPCLYFSEDIVKNNA